MTFTPTTTSITKSAPSSTFFPTAPWVASPTPTHPSSTPLLTLTEVLPVDLAQNNMASVQKAAAWQKYTDSVYGFSFIYPKDWQVQVVDSHHLQLIYGGAILEVGYRFINEKILLAQPAATRGLFEVLRINFMNSEVRILTNPDATPDDSGRQIAYIGGTGEVVRGRLVFSLRLHAPSLDDLIVGFVGDNEPFVNVVGSFRASPEKLTTETGSKVNLAKLGLNQSQTIEIGIFYPSELYNPYRYRSPYQYNFLIKDPDVIDRVVRELDQDVTLQPPSDCIEAYELIFHLADGRQVSFGYGCNGEGTGLARGTSIGDTSIALDGTAPVSPEFTHLIFSLLDQAEAVPLQEGQGMYNPAWKSRIAETDGKVGPFTLEDYAILDPAYFEPIKMVFLRTIPEEVFSRRADQRRRPGNWNGGDPVPPVTVGGHTITVDEIFNPGSYDIAIVRQDGQEIYRIRIPTLVSRSWIENLWGWNGQWVLQVKRQIIIDGKELGVQLGADDIFAWQIIGGKPFALFYRQAQVYAWYDGQVYPLGYDQVVHDQCCGYAIANAGMNDQMVWFFAHRGNEWHYVEMSLN